LIRVFKTKSFARFAIAEGIADAVLCDAIHRADSGLIDADLGGGVIKQRLAREGEGRSGGFRSIVLFRRSALAFFAYGFAKNVRDNIRRDELKVLRILANRMLALNDAGIAAAMRIEEITEVVCDG